MARWSYGDPMAYDYPSDLLQLSADYGRAESDLALAHDAGADQTVIDDLRGRARALAVRLSGHEWWLTLQGEDRTTARSELQRQRNTTPLEPA